jgi:hypothetical protein
VKYFRNMRDRIRRRRRAKSARSEASSLREFVYLDEVSVYSLLASRYGALPAEYTHTETLATTGSLSSSLGAGVSTTKAEISSNSETSRSQSTQVLRKSSIQAAFKDLYDGEEHRLVLVPPRQELDPPQVASLAVTALRQKLESLSGWILDPSALTRGQLIEIEVELQAENIYRFASVFSAMQGIVEEGRSLFAPELYAGVQNVEGINRILSRLLVGLIPIKCRAVDYRVIAVENRRLIVHNKLLSQLPVGSYSEPQDLYIVGVTEQSLFWKDVRRVLFSGSRYRMMCRLNHGGIRSSWVPVKLVDVLSDIAPDLARQIGQLGAAIASLASLQSGEHEGDQRLMTAVLNFGVSLALEHGQCVTPDELAEGFVIPTIEGSRQSEVELQREAFRTMSDIIAARFQITPEVSEVVRLRRAALSASGLEVDGSIKIGLTAPGTEIDGVYSDAIIDTEIVAIYW